MTLIGSVLCLGSYTSFVKAEGVLAPSRGLLPVQAIGAGVVTRLYVKEGDRVAKGDPLVEVSDDQVTEAVGSMRSALAEEMAAKLARFRDDLVGAGADTARRASDLKTKIGFLDEQIAHLSKEMAIQRLRAESAMSLYLAWDGASHSGVVSRVQILQQRDTALQLKAQIEASERLMADITHQRNETASDLVALPAALAEKRRAIERSMADVSQAMLENEARRSRILNAPLEGVVGSVLVHEGDAIEAQAQTMALVPTDSEPRAELWLPTESIGFVQVGDQVRLRYDAFAYRRYGQGRGVVEEVSRTAVSPDQVQRLSGLKVTTPRYRVVTRLSKTTVTAFGKEQPLLPGMTLRAQIILQRRRLIEWAAMPWQSID